MIKKDDEKTYEKIIQITEKWDSNNDEINNESFNEYLKLRRSTLKKIMKDKIKNDSISLIQ